MRELRQREKGRSEEIGSSWMQDERTQSSLGTAKRSVQESRERERERERKDGERDRGREALIS